METIRGRKSLETDINELQKQIAGYQRVVIDLGTGDGRYVRTLAENNPGWFVIGLDACRENLREHSSAKLQNMLFTIANAQDLPRELNGLASHVAINFPWGSLINGLLTGDPKLIYGLNSISRSDTSIDVRLNGGALAEAGWALETGAEKIRNNLMEAGWLFNAPATMDLQALRTFPSTWARRLAFGRDPRTMMLSGRMCTT